MYKVENSKLWRTAIIHFLRLCEVCITTCVTIQRRNEEVYLRLCDKQKRLVLLRLSYYLDMDLAKLPHIYKLAVIWWNGGMHFSNCQYSANGRNTTIRRTATRNRRSNKWLVLRIGVTALHLNIYLSTPCRVQYLLYWFCWRW